MMRPRFTTAISPSLPLERGRTAPPSLSLSLASVVTGNFGMGLSIASRICGTTLRGGTCFKARPRYVIVIDVGFSK